jgi:hypothetical protein
MSSIYSQATQALIWLGEDFSKQNKQATLFSPQHHINPGEVPPAETSKYLDNLSRVVNSWHSEVIANYQIGQFVAGEIHSEMPTLQDMNGLSWKHFSTRTGDLG